MGGLGVSTRFGSGPFWICHLDLVISRGGRDADGWTDRQMPVFPALESSTHDTDVGLAGVK